jgi:hypothetical protein
MLSDRKNPSDEEHRRPRAAQGLSKAIDPSGNRLHHPLADCLSTSSAGFLIR